jgi:hypothetical protein
VRADADSPAEFRTFGVAHLGARHEETEAPCALIVNMEKNREEVVAEVRRRWRERDSTPLIPEFGEGGVGHNLARTRRKA